MGLKVFPRNGTKSQQWVEALEAMAEAIRMQPVDHERFLVVPDWFSAALVQKKGDRAKRKYKGRLLKKRQDEWKRRVDARYSGTTLHIQGTL